MYQTWENHAACVSYPEGECNRIVRNVVYCLQKHAMIYHNTVFPVFNTLQYYSRRNCCKLGWNISSLKKFE